MPRIYYRTSLFLYEASDSEEDESPLLRFWRATVFTFARPAKKETLREILEDYAGTDLTEERGKEAYEAEQVDPAESRGLGFYWVDVSVSESRGRTLLTPEQRVAIYHLPTWEKTHTRLGYEYLRIIRRTLGSVSRWLFGEGA